MNINKNKKFEPSEKAGLKKTRENKVITTNRRDQMKINIKIVATVSIFPLLLHISPNLTYEDSEIERIKIKNGAIERAIKKKTLLIWR